MKHLTDTIREALELATDGPIVDRDGLMREALTALSELEAMVGEQEQSLAFYKRRCDALQQWQSKMRDPERTIVCDILANGHTLEPAGNRYAAPPAQQPQYEAGDMASAAAQGFRDGVASVAQQPHEIEVQCPVCNHTFYAWPGEHKVQQPQAEPFGYVSQHTNGSWEFSPTPAGVYPDTAKSITAVYTKQPQAEAVPSTLRWNYVMQRANTMSTSKYKALCELLHVEVDEELFDLGSAVDAAIAQQKGGAV